MEKLRQLQTAPALGRSTLLLSRRMPWCTPMHVPVVSEKWICMNPQRIAAAARPAICYMTRSLNPFRFVLIALSGWMNQQQLELIYYLREENRVLREQLGRKAITVQR